MKIIQNPEALNQFINWLPKLEKSETYYVTLFARKKYDTTGVIKTDKCQLKRFTSTKEMLFKKISELEISEYTLDKVIVPNESLALYITVNPRDLEKAGKKLLIDLANKITVPYTNWNPQALALNSIQTSCGTKHYMDFDFDNISLTDLKPLVLECINADAVKFLQTRGGVHVIVSLKNIHKGFEKSWYQKLKAIKECDISGDTLIPVPGCCQGAFIPYFVK